MTDKQTSSTSEKYYCCKCDVKCLYYSDYERHLGTAKHKKLTNTDNPTSSTSENTRECICGKKYKHRQSYHTHKKKCNYKTPEEIKEEQLIELQRQLLKEQTEKQLIDFIEKQKRRDEEHKEQLEVLTDKISGMSLVTNHNNNITNNNTFNLNFFLNTQCKDAIDFNSFLRSIKVDDEDIDRFEKNGYFAGMMNVLERNLYNMRIEDRPIHCTDKKRKTIYYKKENGDWEKDGEKLRMPYLIDHIENVSLGYFEKIYRESGGLGDNDTESPRYKWYIKMTFATTGGDYTSAKINRTRIMELLSEEIYVKVIKKNKIHV